MRITSNKAEQEPKQLSARTLKILMSWEKNHGLDIIRQHLDEGLFSRDPVERLLCYRWLEQRRLAHRNNWIVEVVVVVGAVVALVGWLIWSAYP